MQEATVETHTPYKFIGGTSLLYLVCRSERPMFVYKMAAAFVALGIRRRRMLRRERIFRDRLHPLDIYDDVELYSKFRFRRQDILQLTDSIAETIELSNRQGSLTPVLQVLLTLRFYATGTYQDVCAELIGVHQSTASRIIWRVTEALLPSLPRWIRLPNAEEARRSSEKFFQMAGMPDVFGCIDGTHVRIQSPGVGGNEHEFVNRRGQHSINVQVICDADLFFIDVVARWPGSVHDARILRQSGFFEAMEGNHPPVRGHLLGDSGYMLRDWLITPVLNPQTRDEEHFNDVHTSTRSTVERSIGVAKRRWHCLQSVLRVTPDRACQIITVCLILHNRARFLALPDVDSDEESDNGDDDDVDEPRYCGNAVERARVAAGKVARNRLINCISHQH